MITIADLKRLADHPEVAYEGYDELRGAGRRRNSGFANPANIPLIEPVIRRRGRHCCQSVIGKPVSGGLRSISGADADMLMVADERGFEPPLPAWLEQWKAESSGTPQARDEIRTAALDRICGGSMSPDPLTALCARLSPAPKWRLVQHSVPMVARRRSPGAALSGPD